MHLKSFDLVKKQEICLICCVLILVLFTDLQTISWETRRTKIWQKVSVWLVIRSVLQLFVNELNKVWVTFLLCYLLFTSQLFFKMKNLLFFNREPQLWGKRATCGSGRSVADLWQRLFPLTTCLRRIEYQILFIWIFKCNNICCPCLE